MSESQKQNLRIAVAVPSYNHARYLPDLFESILSQSYRNISLYISDDASTDNTREVIEQWKPELLSELPGEVITVFQEKNLGPWDNFIFLQKLLMSRDDDEFQFIQYCESDDFFYPEKFKTQIDFLRQNRALVAVHTDVTTLLEDGSIQKGFWKRHRRGQPGGEDGIPSGFIRDKLLLCNFIMTCSMLVEKSRHFRYYDFEKFRQKLGLSFGDYAFFLALAKDHEIGYIDDDLSYYRVLSNSMSHDPSLRPAIIRDTSRIQKLAREGII